MFMKKIVAIFMLSLGLTLIAGCNAGDIGGQASVLGADSVKSTFQSISVVEAVAMIARASDNFTVLDVRTPEEFAVEHLTNAVNIDYESPDFAEKIKSLDKGKDYLVYCRSGRRSAAASEIMANNGFSGVFNMLGGINAWKEAGGAV